jgi:hypothetical protein
MAWTEAGVKAQSTATAPLGTITLFRLIGGEYITDVFAIGNSVPCQGRVRWVQVLNSENDAGAYAAIISGLSA